MSGSTTQQGQATVPSVADRVGLEALGFILGGVTAIVMLVAVIVVHHHIESKWALNTSGQVISLAQAPVPLRKAVR